MLSQGEKDAWKLLDKCKFIHRNLPDFLQRPLKHPDSRELLDFIDCDSKIEALPSTEKAGRGTDAMFVVRDELAFHPYGRDNFRAISPAIDAGGQLIDLSTIDKDDEENHFTERIHKALDGAEKIVYPSGLELYTRPNSNTALVFLGWKLRPVREEGMTLDEWWAREILPNYEEWEREGEYPATLEEALAPPKITCRFSVDSLYGMRDIPREVIRTDFNGLVRIFHEPQAELKYILVVDPSEGMDDPATGIVIDSRSCEKFADFRGKIPINEQAVISDYLYKMYHSPYTGVERNAQGILLIDKLQAMGVTNMCETSKDKPGWWTSALNRPVMIADLAEAIRLRAIGEHSPDAISQFLSFIRTQKHPDGAARKGAHDDFIMAWAIAWQLRKTMPITNISFKSFKLKTHRENW